MTDIETLEAAWEFFGESPTAVIDVLAIVAQENLGWGGTLDEAVKLLRGCRRYSVYQDATTGEWLAQRLA